MCPVSRFWTANAAWQSRYRVRGVRTKFFRRNFSQRFPHIFSECFRATLFEDTGRFGCGSTSGEKSMFFLHSEIVECVMDFSARETRRWEPARSVRPMRPARHKKHDKRHTTKNSTANSPSACKQNRQVLQPAQFLLNAVNAERGPHCRWLTQNSEEPNSTVQSSRNSDQAAAYGPPPRPPTTSPHPPLFSYSIVLRRARAAMCLYCNMLVLQHARTATCSYSNVLVL